MHGKEHRGCGELVRGRMVSEWLLAARRTRLMNCWRMRAFGYLAPRLAVECDRAPTIAGPVWPP